MAQPVGIGLLKAVLFGPGYNGMSVGGDVDNNFAICIPQQRSIVNAAQAQILPTDTFLNLNLGVSLTWHLPPSAMRNGRLLIFVDAGLQFMAFPQQIVPFGTETFVNYITPSSLTLSNAGAVVAIRPFADGANNGWFIT